MRLIQTQALIGCAVLFLGFETLLGQQIADDHQVGFSRDIRPILSNHCYACHGPDDNARQAGFRLDQPGDVDFEEVLERITSDDDDYVMPPPGFNKPLSADKKLLLEKWVESGANYEQHWSLKPPVKPSIPSNQNPIDFFVDQKLKTAGLVRSPEAKPAVLIRRLYLDLIGVPPSLAEADEFLSDPSEKNYEQIIDKLLASPRYGERWARRWLDLARYADTNGYEKDRDRNIWPYRDWVIRSLNSGMPFDQFTIEQLAGDMLPNPTDDQLIATGFHRNTMLNEEGGIDPLEYRYYAMTDRVATTGTTWLGLTTGCAQCHTHKYDPITHEDYFGLMAYLDNADEPDFYFHTEDSQKRSESGVQRSKTLIAELRSRWPKSTEGDSEPDGFEAEFSAWRKNELENVVPWKVLTPSSMSTNLPNYSFESDGVIYMSGDTTKLDTYTLEFPANQNQITAIQLEALPDRRLPGGGPGLTYYEGRKGDFFLAEITATGLTGRKVEWGMSTETYAANGFGKHPVSAELATDGDIQTGWSVARQNGYRHLAVFNFKTPIPPGEPFKITMKFGRHFASSLGKFRLSVSNSSRPSQASILNEDELNLLRKENAADNARLQHIFLMQSKPVEKFANEIRRLQHPLQGISTLVMRERPASQTRKTFLRHRGEFTSPKYAVSTHLPEAIFNSTKQKQPKNRLEFAQWLVSPENPLTSRVVANRHWQAFFGTGIVKTLDDFGMQGASPSHPELLDWLAVELQEKGWSIKALHRLIVTSKTYRQSSAKNGAATVSENLLSRFPRRRLEAEVIRDAALAASGQLQLKMYGPPVRPPQPEGAAANFQSSRWQASQGIDRFRRSIYTYQKRTAPFAMFTTFDASSGEVCLAQRDVSNTPLQALTLMNDPMFMEIAEAFGKVIAAGSGDDREKIVTGFRRLLTRFPEKSELEMLTSFFQKHQDWTAIARVLLCLDESICNN